MVKTEQEGLKFLQPSCLHFYSLPKYTYGLPGIALTMTTTMEHNLAQPTDIIILIIMYLDLANYVIHFLILPVMQVKSR